MLVNSGVVEISEKLSTGILEKDLKGGRGGF